MDHSFDLNLPSLSEEVSEIYLTPFLLRDHVVFLQESVEDHMVSNIVNFFRNNIESSISVASAMVSITHLAHIEVVSATLYSRLLESVQESNDRIELEEVREILKEYQSAPEKRVEYGALLSRWLSKYQRVPALYVLQRNLMQQGYASVWTAFEVFSRDLLEYFLNKRPRLAIRVAKSVFDVKQIQVADFAGYDFDFSNKMGTFLMKNREITSYFDLKDLYKSCLGDDQLIMSELNKDYLRKLNKTRNVISHKSGVIDDKYLAEFPGSGLTGDNISISASEFRNVSTSVWSLGVTIAKELDRRLSIAEETD